VLPRARSATFLVAEPVGAGALAAARPAEEVALSLAARRDLVLPALRAFRGRLAAGDGLVAAFRSPTNAVLCAMAIQDRLLAWNRASGGDRLLLRIAVHLGETRAQGDGLAGAALDVARAIARGAGPGEIRLSRAVYLAMTRGEVKLEPLAPMEGAGEPLPLYRVERVERGSYGGREAALVPAPGRAGRALAPLLDLFRAGSGVLSENRVVLLADARGAAAATCQTREESARMRLVNDALVLPVVRRFRGRRVPSAGESYLALFDAPTDALLCATAIQDRLWAYDREVPEAERVEGKVALAMGEVRLGGGDVFGEALNLVARMEAEAEAGEIWVGESLWWAMEGARAAAEDMGSRRLKGFVDPVRLFRLARRAGEGPPYGGAALGLAPGLASPDPASLARRAAWSSRARRARAPLAAAAILVAVGAIASGALLAPSTERLLARGELDAAAARVASLAETRGEEDAEVLYLRGLLDAAQAERGAAERLPLAFHAWSRAAAKGSGDALATLAREGASADCERRLLAARALSSAGTPGAAGPLRAMAAAEPPPPEGPGALARVLREVDATVRCGAGDLAREGLRALETR
jgi:class 3 adenylate cyclase